MSSTADELRALRTQLADDLIGDNNRRSHVTLRVSLAIACALVASIVMGSIVRTQRPSTRPATNDPLFQPL